MIFACPAERERLAYRAQDDWLQLFDHDIQSAFGIDPARSSWRPFAPTDMSNVSAYGTDLRFL